MFNFAHNRKQTSNAGFTLIELLAVLGIIGLLLVLVFPAVNLLREAGRNAKCKSNLKSMAVAAVAYAEDHRGEFPWGQRRRVPGYSKWCWDFVVPSNGSAQPGVMWDGYGVNQILQCPSFLEGASNASGDPYTGYNYNVSFIGKVEGDPGRRQRPARLAQIKEPDRTALFGDGHYSKGANKFMRAPKYDETHDDSSESIRKAGTQGFRHNGKTNIAFCDGHVESFGDVYNTGGKPAAVSMSGSVKCGFISEDNRLYALEK